MASSINATGARDPGAALFNKLDTKQKGYIDAADLKTALGPNADQGKADALLKQLDGNGDGRVTKSELSVAIKKVGDELSAQQDQARVKQGGAGAHAGGAGRPPPAKADGAASASDIKYVAAADSDGNGTVSEAEQAAYEKLLAAAEEKARAQAGEYKKIAGEEPRATAAFNVSA
jgi:hypothetical protein